MKRYVIYNDVHLYGPHELNLGADLLLEGGESIYLGDIYLGDNVDMNHVKKKDIFAAKVELKALSAIYGDRFIPGNHELDQVPGPRSYIDNGICFEHGDYLFWGEEKRNKYMKGKTVGAGWFSRMFITMTLDHLRKVFKARYSDEFKERAFKRAAKMKCHTIVVGHKHPKEMADFRFRGVRIIVLPRGKNELAL